MLRILHLEDSPLDAELIRARLRSDGLVCEIHHVTSREEFTAALAVADFDLIISDYTVPSFDGAVALAVARKLCPHKPFLFVSGTLGEEAAVESLRNGATDYVLKHRPERLGAAVRRALQESDERERRRLAEEELREKAALLDEAQEAICVTDPELVIRYWNKGAENLYGWTRAEATGRHANELLVQGDVSAAQAAWESVRTNNGWQGELEQVTKDQGRIVVESRWVLTRSGSGPKAIMMISTDISEKRRIEARLLRAQRMESIGALASGIAHDLNNVLAPVLMGTDLIYEQLDDEEDRRILDMVRASAHRGSELVRQILSFTRGMDGERQILELKHLIGETRRLMESTFPVSIKLEDHVQPGVPPIRGNATQLHQVLLNLCVNARDAMPHGGSLRIEARMETTAESSGRADAIARFVVISVADTGTGIPTDRLERIFEPFFTTKEADKGTGLGLSTVKSIATQHGGFVKVTSTVGAGTTFSVHLPAQMDGRVATPLAEPVILPPGQGQLILVVDDEAALVQIMRTVLETYQYRVLTAHNGARALQLYEEHSGEIQVVLTDIAMPVLDGPAMIRKLREIKPGLLIIGSSGTLSIDQKRNMDTLGLQATLQKPYTPETLLRTLHTLLAPAAT